MKGSRIATALLAAVCLTGCASIIKRGDQNVVIGSEPQGATVTIRNKAGLAVHQGTTPFTVSVRRGNGFWKHEDYVLNVEKPGYVTQETKLEWGVEGWYLGNVLFGGLIGMLIVDPATGAMWKVNPDTVQIPLALQDAVPVPDAPDVIPPLP